MYLSYSAKDNSLVQIIKEMLIAKYPEIRMFSQHQNIDENMPWQEDVYEVSCVSSHPKLTINRREISITKSFISQLVAISYCRVFYSMVQ